LLLLTVSFALPDDEPILLNVEHPHKNSHWILPIKSSSIKVGDDKAVVEALTVYMPVFDSRDIMKKKYQATLLSDGSGISVTIPTLFLAILDQVEEIHALEHHALCEQTKTQHAVAATYVKSKPERLTKTLILKFPRGMTGNNKHFNGKNASSDESILKLKNHYRILDIVVGTDEDDDEEIETINFIWWKVVIGEPQRLADESDESEDDYQDALSRRMSRVKVQDSTMDGQE
jgi:hypothetical protein